MYNVDIFNAHYVCDDKEAVLELLDELNELLTNIQSSFILSEAHQEAEGLYQEDNWGTAGYSFFRGFYHKYADKENFPNVISWIKHCCDEDIIDTPPEALHQYDVPEYKLTFKNDWLNILCNEINSANNQVDINL